MRPILGGMVAVLLLATSTSAWPDALESRADRSTSGISDAGENTASLTSSSNATPATSTMATSNGGTTTKSASVTSDPFASSTDTLPSETRTSQDSSASNAPKPSDSAFPVCHHSSGPLAPFCLPTNGTEVWVGVTFHVTWDASYFPINSTINMELNYAQNDTKDLVKQAWHSPSTQNSYGFVLVTMDGAWLQDLPRNNLTFLLVQKDATPSSQPSFVRGPTISLTKKPVEHLQPSPPNRVSKLGLAVGLPLSLLVVSVIVLGVLYGIRRTRRLGLASLSVGRRRGGYGIGQSRRERTRVDKDGVRLDDTSHHRHRIPADTVFHYEDDAGGFTDEPTHGLPIGDPQAGRGKYDVNTNAFRNEIERQRNLR